MFGKDGVGGEGGAEGEGYVVRRRPFGGLGLGWVGLLMYIV